MSSVSRLTISELRTASSIVDAAEIGRLDAPRFAGIEVPASAVGDELVREPLPSRRQVTVEESFHGRLQLSEQGGVIHGPSLPTSR